MTTRGDFRDMVRAEIGDDGATKIWPDAELNGWINASNDWYSRLFPVKSWAFVETKSTVREYSLSPGMIEIERVELPWGVIIPREEFATYGDPNVHDRRYRQAWSIHDDNLYLRNYPTGDEVGASKMVIHYMTYHMRCDELTNWGGPPEDERLIVLWVCVQVWRWLDGQEAKFGRKATGQAEQARALLDAALRDRRKLTSAPYRSRTLQVEEY
jgi:hypothetical protein